MRIDTDNRIWYGTDELEPGKDGIYLVRLKDGKVCTLRWCGCWNCAIDPITGEKYQYNRRFDVTEWSKL